MVQPRYKYSGPSLCLCGVPLCIHEYYAVSVFVSVSDKRLVMQKHTGSVHVIQLCRPVCLSSAFQVSTPAHLFSVADL